MPQEIQAGVPQDSILSPALYSLYVNDTPQTIGGIIYIQSALFADDTCIYTKHC